MDSFFGIGLAELFFIAVIALVVLGPKRLPETIRQVARAWGYVRNLSRELMAQFSEEFKALEEMNPRALLKELADEVEREANQAAGKLPPAGAGDATPQTPAPSLPTRPPSNTVQVHSEARTDALARPSGTEPNARPNLPATTGTVTARKSKGEPQPVDEAA
jgi:sec-independent protein translocase protein TatB